MYLHVLIYNYSGSRILSEQVTVPQPKFLCNLNVQYRVHTSVSEVTILINRAQRHTKGYKITVGSRTRSDVFKKMTKTEMT